MNDSTLVKFAKKLKIVNRLGGVCDECKCKQLQTLDFHHTDANEKEYEISLGLANMSLADIESEISKCILLCKNCHRVFHNREPSQYKLECLAYKGTINCSHCQLTVNPVALDFHHVDPSSKKFNISSRRTLTNTVKKELDKCIVLCANCHSIEHAQLSREDIIKIEEKALRIRHTKKVNIEILLKLVDAGMGVSEIANKLNTNKSTISTIFNRLSINTGFSHVNQDDIIKLHNMGLSAIDISNRLKCSKSTVFNFLKNNNIKPNKNKTRRNRKKMPTVNDILSMKPESLQNIAKHFGISRQTLYNILKT